jgi:ABC-type transporter Mla subunit MlaD
MRWFALTCAAVVLLGTGCSEQVQGNVDQLNQKVEQTKQVSDDLQNLSTDLKTLLGEPNADTTSAQPSEDQPQP